MKLAEALQEIKDLRSLLTRKQTLRKELFTLEKDEKSEFSFDNLTKEINNIHERIAVLKVALQFANTDINKMVTIPLPTGDVIMTIAEAIIRMGIAKSELDQYQTSLIPQTKSRSRVLFREEMDVVEYFHPISQKKRQEKIDELEKIKRIYDRAIQGANWKYSINSEYLK